MRILILLTSLFILTACASTQSGRDSFSDLDRRSGVIVARERVTSDQVKKQESRVSTGVYGSVFSGGGVSLGLGLLFSPSTKKSARLYRYQVKTLDGEELVIYSESADFEVDDCVEVTLYEASQKKPPTLRRNRSAC